MTLQLLKSNIKKEKEIINELVTLVRQYEQFRQGGSTQNEVKLLETSITSLMNQLRIINNAIPDMLNNIQFYKKISPAPIAKKPIAAKKLTHISYKNPKADKKVELAIKKKEKLKFLESLALKRGSAKKLQKSELKIKGAGKGKVSGLTQQFIRLSNKSFRKPVDKLIAKKWFVSLNKDLRSITSPFLLNSYVSMMFLATAIALVFGLILAVLFILLGIPALGMAILFLAPLTIFLLFYSYPGSQKKSLEKEINQELPFVTIYMSAVATSGIEPSRIFEIIVRTKDYFYTQREIKKILNYINFYGYDLVSALRYSAKNCPSERLSILLNGLGTTIRSGGELSDFLNKHAETLLFDYRLEREKYTKIAETFMDIYISIVIAAPMILMILFVLISLTGYGAAFLTPAMLSFLVIGIVSALNVGFLIFLNMKQPKF